MSQQPQPSKKKPPLSNYARYTSIGLQIIVVILIFLFAGHKIDGWTHQSFPIFTLILSIIGLAAAMWFMVRELMRKD